MRRDPIDILSDTDELLSVGEIRQLKKLADSINADPDKEQTLRKGVIFTLNEKFNILDKLGDLSNCSEEEKGLIEFYKKITVEAKVAEHIDIDGDLLDLESIKQGKDLLYELNGTKDVQIQNQILENMGDYIVCDNDQLGGIFHALKGNIEGQKILITKLKLEEDLELAQLNSILENLDNSLHGDFISKINNIEFKSVYDLYNLFRNLDETLYEEVIIKISKNYSENEDVYALILGETRGKIVLQGVVESHFNVIEFIKDENFAMAMKGIVGDIELQKKMFKKGYNIDDFSENSLFTIANSIYNTPELLEEFISRWEENIFDIDELWMQLLLYTSDSPELNQKVLELGKKSLSSLQELHVDMTVADIAGLLESTDESLDLEYNVRRIFEELSIDIIEENIFIEQWPKLIIDKLIESNLKIDKENEKEMIRSFLEILKSFIDVEEIKITASNINEFYKNLDKDKFVGEMFKLKDIEEDYVLQDTGFTVFNIMSNKKHQSLDSITSQDVFFEYKKQSLTDILDEVLYEISEEQVIEFRKIVNSLTIENEEIVMKEIDAFLLGIGLDEYYLEESLSEIEKSKNNITQIVSYLKTDEKFQEFWNKNEKETAVLREKIEEVNSILEDEEKFEEFHQAWGAYYEDNYSGVFKDKESAKVGLLQSNTIAIDEKTEVKEVSSSQDNTIGFFQEIDYISGDKIQVTLDGKNANDVQFIEINKGSIEENNRELIRMMLQQNGLDINILDGSFDDFNKRLGINLKEQIESKDFKRIIELMGKFIYEKIESNIDECGLILKPTLEKVSLEIIKNPMKGVRNFFDILNSDIAFKLGFYTNFSQKELDISFLFGQGDYMLVKDFYMNKRKEI